MALTVAVFSLLVAACSGDDDSGVAWSSDPCGLAPPQAVAEAFGEDPIIVGSPPPGECRYQVGDTLVRVVVLADSDTCEGARRTLVSLNETLERPPETPGGVYVTVPSGDVLVCDPEATYLMYADGRSDQLLVLAATPPSERSD
jgi:hypothetical protein